MLLPAEVKEGRATVRSKRGICEIKVGDQPWQPLNVSMSLPPGVTLRTPKDGYADISVNGFSSIIRLEAETVLQIVKMNFWGDLRTTDQETLLNLTAGSLIGNVRKVSQNSRYEIQTPCGLVGIRGTDFQITVPNGTNGAGTTFTSVTGQIVVATTSGVVRILKTGESWSPCGVGIGAEDETSETTRRRHG
ncbi:MAG TPA: FecR domain-containing protein [Verrucomicrobiae bacterium]|jgi:hypothetical protein|nr:FecR domain-containing protein [Verrucomicrobiae bacterium]